MRVVGVVKEVRQTSLEQRESVGLFYLPFAQSPQPRMTFAVRSGGEAVELTRAIRRAIAGVDAELAVFDVQTMGERTDLSLSSRRTSMTLALAFGALALVLSATGIYGVLAYVVTQRRREIGIRVALGSSRARIVGLVVRQGLVLVGIGLAAGAGGAMAMQRAVASEVYGVEPLEPAVLASAVGILAVTGLAACLLPARRALGVDPVRVLHE
jgi:ABC-type antimicrobial peptide transport system permease subunit